jgi:hypothetical protein
MNNTVEMVSDGTIDIPSFIRIGSGIQNLLEGIHVQTHRQQGDLIGLLLCFQNMESILKGDRLSF